VAAVPAPGDKRGCTDLLCNLMLIACWVAMTGLGMVVMGVVSSESLPAGDPARLINGMD